LGASFEELGARTNIGELILDLKLRPRLSMTIGDVVAESEGDLAQAQRLLNALGLPTDPEAHITAEERVAIRVMTAAASDLLGYETTLQLARTAGWAMARIAEALVTAVRLRVELPNRDLGEPYRNAVQRYSELAATVLPDFVLTLDATLRRRIMDVAERVWSSDEERSTIILPRTVGFADLVGYTATAATLSAKELTAILVEFDEVTSAIVLEGGGQIVKTIGDEAMFITDEPLSACRIADRLVKSFDKEGLPAIRVGLASGDLVSVFGDFYGAEVNLAARLVDAAESSMVLVSDRISRECSAVFSFEPLLPLRVRGIAEPVAAARLIPS
jgi:adenylate cyclase